MQHNPWSARALGLIPVLAATALSLMLAGALAIMSAVYFRVTRAWSTS